MLDEEKEKRVVETVFEKLWTPCGLRTLERDDPQFHPSYGGEMRERDMAYHQGTVWPFPWELLPGLSESPRLFPGCERKGERADGRTGERPQGGMRRTASGDL